MELLILRIQNGRKIGQYCSLLAQNRPPIKILCIIKHKYTRIDISLVLGGVEAQVPHRVHMPHWDWPLTKELHIKVLRHHEHPHTHSSTWPFAAHWLVCLLSPHQPQYWGLGCKGAGPWAWNLLFIKGSHTRYKYLNNLNNCRWGFETLKTEKSSPSFYIGWSGEHLWAGNIEREPMENWTRSP